jgi:predicted polyphosphate/ATP-dependent NAD kinase
MRWHSVIESEIEFVQRFRIGLVLNPIAGLGGPAALKGTDGREIVAEALQRGSDCHVTDRTVTCLAQLADISDHLSIVTCPGDMGEIACTQAGLSCDVVGSTSDLTSAEDTRIAVRAFQDLGVELILFAGGDGTARDVADVISPDQVCLGIPCGVKMHSGVFANNPQAAGHVVSSMVRGELVTALTGEVRDIDEAALRDGVVRTQHYGELRIPAEIRYIQHTKDSGREIEPLVLSEIAAEVIDNMTPEVTYFIGPGSTTREIMSSLMLENTLLGVDVVRDNCLVAADATESELFEVTRSGPAKIVVTIIAGQGHLFGRGNQQFSSRVIRAVGIENIIVVSTKSKLKTLGNRPLIVDTGNVELDETLCGMMQVITGYEDAVFVRVVA